MSFFNQLGRKQVVQQPQQPQQRPNPMQMMQQLRADPVGFLRQAGYNIPDGMTDPQQITNHLTQSGQVSQQQYQQAMQMMQGMKR